MRQEQRNIPLFHSEIGLTFGWVFIRARKLFIRRVRKITRPVCFVKQNRNSSSSMISSIRHKQSISWTFLNDAMATSAKEMPKNHTDKERFAAASSCIQTGILTLLFPRKRRRSSPSRSVYQPPRSRSRRVSYLKVPNIFAFTTLTK